MGPSLPPDETYISSIKKHLETSSAIDTATFLGQFGFEDFEELRKMGEFAEELRKESDSRWKPPQPSSDAFIWRYLNFTQLLSIFERDAIWFTDVNQFEDPYEGTLPKANLEAEVERIQDEFDISRERAVRVHGYALGGSRIFGGNAYVNCWNVNDHQSAALWEQYVDSPQGIAIRTTVDELGQSLENAPYDFEFGSVEYIDYNKDRIPNGELPTIYHKRKSFEHEKEFRVSVFEDDEEDFGRGFYAPIDTNVLIGKVVISPIAPGWFSELVKKVLDRYEIDCELDESGLYSDPDVTIS